LSLLVLFAVAVGLRAWSLRHGFPYAYNVDEDGHFAPVAVNTVLTGWNPHYFENPPALSYLLRLVFQAGWGKGGLVVQWANDPEPMLLAARWASALLGSLTCVVVALAGARLFSRFAGFVAGIILAVAVLPVFYGHLALNDVPALLPIAIALFAVAGLLNSRLAAGPAEAVAEESTFGAPQRSGRLADWALAGLAVGVAASTKYTAAVVLVAVICAAVPFGRRALRGLLISGVAALAGFAITNPYALLSLGEFRAGLSRQSDFSSQKLIGLWTANPFAYYGSVALWGFGLLPLLAALVGFVVLVRTDRVKAAVLTLAPLALLASLSVNLILSGEGQMYSRWLLPAFPFLCLLAGFGASVVVPRVAAALRPRGQAAIAPDSSAGIEWSSRACAAAALVVTALAAQGVFLSARTNTVLAHTDTRQQLRDWMVTHVGRDSKIVIEAFSMPPGWYINTPWAKPHLPGAGGRIWNIAQPFLTTLSPARIDGFRKEGRCLLVVTSNIRDRALKEPRAVPGAVGFYKRLNAESTALFSTSPWKPSHQPSFDFDRSYIYFDGSYERPGPRAEVRALTDCTERASQ
jgi:hypothetical protein